MRGTDGQAGYEAMAMGLGYCHRWNMQAEVPLNSFLRVSVCTELMGTSGGKR